MSVWACLWRCYGLCAYYIEKMRLIRGKLSNSMVREIEAARIWKWKFFAKQQTTATWRSEKPHYHEDVWDNTVLQVVNIFMRKLGSNFTYFIILIPLLSIARSWKPIIITISEINVIVNVIFSNTNDRHQRLQFSSTKGGDNGVVWPDISVELSSVKLIMYVNRLIKASIQQCCHLKSSLCS